MKVVKYFSFLILFSAQLECMIAENKMLKGVTENDSKLIKEAIEEGFDVNSSILWGISSEFNEEYGTAVICPPLLATTYYSDIDINILEILVKAGTDIEAEDWRGRTLLAKAVRKKNFRIIKFIIKCDADVNSIDYDGCSILNTAIGTGDINVVKILVENGANMFFEFDKKSILDQAKRFGNSKIINFLERSIKRLEVDVEKYIPKDLLSLVLGYLGSDYIPKKKKIKRNCDVCVIS